MEPGTTDTEQSSLHQHLFVFQPLETNEGLSPLALSLAFYMGIVLVNFFILVRKIMKLTPCHSFWNLDASSLVQISVLIP